MSGAVDSLNFHHLRYFWCVVVEGGIQPASRRLRVSHPTISAQLRQLEENLNESLFDRSGRKLALTAAGRVVFDYAHRIFGLGQELLDTVQGRDRGGFRRLRVGVTDDLPKLLVKRLVEPVLGHDNSPCLVVEEGRQETLLARLGLRDLDVVLSDAPLPSGLGIAAFDRELGSSGVSFLASPKLAATLAPGFPACLDGAPFLAPYPDTRFGRSLAGWMRLEGIRPKTVAEIEDSALTKTFGEDGYGVFCVPRVAEALAIREFGVSVVGRTSALRIRYFAATLDRQLTDPFLRAIILSAPSEFSEA